MKSIKYYLIAQETNDYKPWINSTTAMVFFTVVVWGLKLIIPSYITAAAGALDPKDLMNRINTERSNRYLPQLLTNDKLITAAQSKADDMLARSYFAHVDPDGNYVWPRIEAAGYKPYTTLGENLAMDFTSPDELVAAWMNSPTHRANILNDKFKDQGLALASGNYETNHYTTLVASLFGALATPGSQASSVSNSTVVNSTGNTSSFAIVNNPKVSVTQISGHNVIDVTITVNGNPTLVTASLKGQSINLLKQSDGVYEGEFTFNIQESLNGEKITIEARDSSGSKASSVITLDNINTLPANDQGSINPASAEIPVSREAQIFKILRIIFGVLSVIYLGFLTINAIILKRNKIQRPGLRSSPQIIVFLLLSALNLFIGKF